MSSDLLLDYIEDLDWCRLNPLKSGHVFGFQDILPLVVDNSPSLNPLKSGHVFGSAIVVVEDGVECCLNPLKSGHVFGFVSFYLLFKPVYMS